MQIDHCIHPTALSLMRKWSPSRRKKYTITATVCNLASSHSKDLKKIMPSWIGNMLLLQLEIWCSSTPQFSMECGLAISIMCTAPWISTSAMVPWKVVFNQCHSRHKWSSIASQFEQTPQSLESNDSSSMAGFKWANNWLDQALCIHREGSKEGLLHDQICKCLNTCVQKVCVNHLLSPGIRCQHWLTSACLWQRNWAQHFLPETWLVESTFRKPILRASLS